MKPLADWSNLPHELLTIIFNKLYKSFDDSGDSDYEDDGLDYDNGLDIGQCALTCRGWRATAQAIRFCRMGLNEEDKIESLADVSSSTSALVKIVNYDVFGDITENYDQYMTMIADAFPFVEQLVYNIDDSTFLAIHTLLTKGKFTNLKSIPPPINMYQTELYVSCILSIKERVNKIEILPRYFNISESIIYEKLFCDNKNRFPKLNKLEISTQLGEQDNIKDFVESKIPNAEMNFLKLVIDCASKRNDTPQEPIKTSTCQVRPSYRLRKLFLEFPCEAFCNDDRSLLFIMEKYPNIENIRFENDCTLFFKRGKSAIPSIPVGVEFLSYLYKMPHCLVTNLTTDNNTDEIVSQVYKNFDGAITNSKFRNIISIDVMDNVEGDREDLNTASLMRIENKTINCINERRIKVEFKTIENDDKNAPYYSFIEKVGKYVHELSFRRELNIDRSLLLCIVEKCIRLERLKICSTCARESFLFELRDRANSTNNIESGIEHGLKQLSIQFYVDDVYNDVFLPLISSCFPHLEVLEVVHDVYHTDLIKAQYLPIIIPNSSLKSLVIVKEDIGIMYYAKLFFKLITTEDNQTNYFCLNLSPSKADKRKRLKCEDHDSNNKKYITTRLSPKKYEDSKEEELYPTIFIQCKTLDKFTLKFETSFGEEIQAHCFIKQLFKA